MNREQRQRLNQLTPEQRAWQKRQQAYASSVPYTYGQGQVDWLAQMEAMYPAQPQKRNRSKQDWANPKSMMDPSMAERSEVTGPNSANTGPVPSPFIKDQPNQQVQSAVGAYAQQSVPPWSLPPLRQNQNQLPATITDLLYRYQGQPRAELQPMPYYPNPAGLQIQLLNNEAQPTLYWTNHIPGASPAQIQYQQNHQAEQARLRAYSQAYLGNNPRYIKDVPSISAPISPPGPWQQGQMTSPDYKQKADEEVARRFHQEYSERMKRRFGPKHPKPAPGPLIEDIDKNIDSFVEWAKENEITPAGLEKFIRKGPGWLLGGKNIEKMAYFLDDALKTMGPYKPVIDALNTAAFGALVLTFSGGTASLPIMMQQLGRLGIAGGVSSVINHVGVEGLKKTGASEERAQEVVSYVNWFSSYRDLSKFFKNTRSLYNNLPGIFEYFTTPRTI